MNFSEESGQFAPGSNSGFGFGNFDPSLIQEDEVINVVLALDVSVSMRDCMSDLNDAAKEFINEFQGSHVADKIMLSIITFGARVTIKTGYQPIKSIDSSKFDFRANEGSTCLYDACYDGVKNALDYREQLEKTGVNSKTIVFVATDGDDTSSKRSPSECKNLLEDLFKTEKNVLTFETILFGLGTSGSFDSAQKAVGFAHLLKLGNTGKDMRKLIGFISASVSKSASGQPISF